MSWQNGTCPREQTADAFMRFKSPKRSISSAMHYSPIPRLPECFIYPFSFFSFSSFLYTSSLFLSSSFLSFFQLSELVTAPTSSDTSAYRVASQKKLKRKTKKEELGLSFLLCLLSFFTQPVANNAKCCVPVWIFACIAYLDESVSLTIVSRCWQKYPNSLLVYNCS